VSCGHFLILTCFHRLLNRRPQHNQPKTLLSLEVTVGAAVAVAVAVYWKKIIQTV
jgi:hypothetical protein